MTNFNDRKNHPNPSPGDSNIPGVTGTNETNINEGSSVDQAAYRDGYVHGRTVEQTRLDGTQEVRDNDNAARGLLLGTLLTGLVALTVGATYFLSQRNQTPVPNSTIVVPKSSPAPSQSPQVIERDRVVPVPVPQQQAPAPNVNITVPSPSSQAPAARPAPATQPAPAPAAPTQSAPTQSAPTQSAPVAPSSAPATQPAPTAPSGSSQSQPNSAPSTSAPGSAPTSPSGSGSN
jgi:hypothetical protein